MSKNFSSIKNWIKKLRSQKLTENIDPEVYDIATSNVTRFRNMIYKYENISDIIDKTFERYKYQGTTGVNKRVEIVVSNVYLRPIFMTESDLKKTNFKYSQYSNCSEYLENGYEVGYVTYNNTTHLVYKVSNKYKKFVNNKVKKKGHVQSKNSWPPYLENGYEYFTLSPYPKTPVWSTREISRTRYIMFIFTCISAPYLPVMGIAERIDEGSKGSWFGHVWITTTLFDKKENKCVTNILDTYESSVYNLQYARQLSYIFEKYYNIVIPMVNPELSIVYDNCNTSFQKKDPWGLCQTLTLIIYLILIQNPTLGSQPLEYVLSRTPSYLKYINAIDSIMDIGNEFAAIRKTDLDEFMDLGDTAKEYIHIN